MAEISSDGGSVVRQEKIEIGMVVDKSVCERCEKAVKTLVETDISQMVSGDDLVITYRFYCDYFGNVVEALQAVEKILDDPETVVKKADCVALEEGRILIFEVLTKLNDVIRKVKGVTPPRQEKDQHDNDTT